MGTIRAALRLTRRAGSTRRRFYVTLVRPSHPFVLTPGKERRKESVSASAQGVAVLRDVSLMLFQSLGKSMVTLVVAHEVEIVGPGRMHRRNQGPLSWIGNGAGRQSLIP